MSDPAEDPTATPDRPDPWVHRAANMRCRTCIWWVPKENEFLDGKLVGRCRKGAPTMDGFPVAFEDDWCGKHKLHGLPGDKEQLPF